MERARGHPSRLVVKNGEHLRMTVVEMQLPGSM
jgi:hypothetical protein